jgi:hypothetical protein
MAQYYKIKMLKIQYKLLIYLLMLNALDAVYAQNTLEYEYSLNDSISGIIHVEQQEENDSIFDGNFKFVTTFKNTNPFNTKTSLTYEGIYKNDLKSGLWTFRQKSFKALQNHSEEDYKLNFKTSGKELFLSANFQEGQAQEKWYAEERVFNNSKVENIVFTLDAEFNDSKLVNTLQAYSPNLIVELNFDEDGFANGNWVFKHKLNGKTIEDIFNFENGVYKKRELKIDDKSLEITQLGLDTNIKKGSDIFYDQGMLQVFNLITFKQNENPDDEAILKDINEISLSHLDKVLNIFKTYDGFDIWQNFRGSKALKIGGFKIKKHPLSPLEKSQIQDIEDKLVKINQSIDNTLNHSFLEIGKLNYEELNIQESVLTTYKNYVSKLDDLIDKLNTKEIEYINYNSILPEWLPEVNFPENLSYSFKDEALSTAYNFPKPLKKEDVSINSISKLINTIYGEVLKSEKKANDIFKKLTKKEALSDREQEFLTLKKKLIALYSNQNENTNYNTYHEAVSTNFIQIVNTQYNAFASLEIEVKEKQINNYLECYNNLETAYKSIENFPLKLNRLNDLYSLTTFNPYIMSDMTERLKSRIYNAFEDVLMPEIIEDLKSAKSCEDVNQTLELFDTTYKRLVVLIDEDTKDIEKQLKREKNPQKIMEILNINPSLY